MTLRSSPRKRLLLTDITPISPDQSHATTPRKSNSTQTKQTFPGGKRLKFDEKPIAQTNIDVPLSDTLKGKTITTERFSFKKKNSVCLFHFQAIHEIN